MATPQNPLDKFATYTYHFELHAAATTDELLKADEQDFSQTTSRFASNNTLLINTRTDAHQSIDELNFTILLPGTQLGGPVPLSSMTMMIREPGGFGFIEKIWRRMNEVQCTLLSEMPFGLKIFFVGRTPDINEPPRTIALPMLPLRMIDMKSSFTVEGGVYVLSFGTETTLASTRHGTEGPHLNYSFLSKNITFKANTLREALTNFEERLNSSYQEMYKTEIDRGAARPLKYKLVVDSKLSGAVNSLVKSTFDPTDKSIFSFHHKQSITLALREILFSSPDLTSNIKFDVGNDFNKQAAFVPVITPKVFKGPSETEVIFELSVYLGGAGAKDYGLEYIFDYYFAEAGSNVDVDSFEINYNQTQAFINHNYQGLDAHANLSATITGKQAHSSLHEPVTQERLQYREVKKVTLDAKAGDDAIPPAATAFDTNGYNSTRAQDVPMLKMAHENLSAFNSSVGAEHVLNLRGHLDVLEKCIIRYDTPTADSYIVNGMWFKVNIWMPDERAEGKKRQFFYTGFYRVVGITNIFSNGRFVQQCVMSAAPNSVDFGAVAQPPQPAQTGSAWSTNSGKWNNPSSYKSEQPSVGVSGANDAAFGIYPR